MEEDNKDSRINIINQRVSILSDKILFIENRLDNIAKWTDVFSGIISLPLIILSAFFKRECDAGCQGCQSGESKE